MSGLKVQAADLIDQPGATKKIAKSLPIQGLRGVLAWVGEDEDVTVDLVAETVLEGIDVSGTVSGVLHLSCSRCLREFEEPFRHEVSEIFYRDREEVEERYQIEDESIDLEPMVRDLIVLAIPQYPLHAPGCKGLCPVCGSDLNEIDCGHAVQEPDPRWAPLRNLFPKQEE